jgi:hypothetical protein
MKINGLMKKRWYKAWVQDQLGTEGNVTLATDEYVDLVPALTYMNEFNASELDSAWEVGPASGSLTPSDAAGNYRDLHISNVIYGRIITGSYSSTYDYDMDDMYSLALAGPNTWVIQSGTWEEIRTASGTTLWYGTGSSSTDPSTVTYWTGAFGSGSVEVISS